MINGQMVEVPLDQLKIAAEQQRMATLMLLAAGKPIYQVDLRGDAPVVTLQGNVPQPPSK